MQMKAIVLCGGLGTRLGEITRNTPKPLVPVAGRPFLAHVLDKLCIPEVDSFILATSFHADQVINTMGTAWQGRPVQYSVEPKARGTGGAIRLAMDSFGVDTALVANGDTLFDCDLSALVADFEGSRWVTRMALRHVEDCARYGRVQLAGDARVIGFGEKGHIGSGLINAGAYVQRREPLITFGAETFSFETDYLAAMHSKLPMQGIIGSGYFIDIGVPKDLERAQIEINKKTKATG